MAILSVNKRKQMIDYLVIVVLSGIVHFIFQYDMWTALGMVFIIFFGVDVAMIGISNIIAPIMFTPVYPSSVSELKHTDKSYQYILKLKDKSIYTVAYRQPLEKVTIQCYKYLGSYFCKVKKKR